MKEKLLITGASGFIGFHLMKYALDAGFEVYAAIRASSNIDHFQGLQVKTATFDFLDKENIRKNFERDQYDYVIHAAGLTRAKTDEEYFQANVITTKNLADVAEEFSVKKFIFFSSLAAIGPIPFDKEKKITEATRPHPVTKYGKSKWLAEMELQNFKKLSWIIIRPTAVYGPREKDLFILFKTLKKNLDLYIGRNEQILSFVYASDLAKLTIQALKSDIEQQGYNISDGHAYSKYDLAEAAKDVLAIKPFRFHLPLPMVRVVASILEATSGKKAPVLSRDKLHELTAENWNVDISKAQNDLNYFSEYNLQKGIKQTLEWYKDKKWL